MPVLAVGGEKSFGSLQAIIMRHVASNVQEAVVKGSGHWLMDERPAETVALIRSFLEAGFPQEYAIKSSSYGTAATEDQYCATVWKTAEAVPYRWISLATKHLHVGSRSYGDHEKPSGSCV